MNYHLTQHDATKKLSMDESRSFVVLLRHGTMQLEYFAPFPVDNQQPHQQDELYVIASGSSEFYRNGEVISCSKGDVIFVPALMEHRFLNMSNDFATWVILYGPAGGEDTES